MWLEAALLLALLVTAFLERAFARGRLVFLAFFVVATVCCLLSAHNFITDVAIGPVNVRDLGQDAVNAAAAGFTLLAFTDFVLIIVLGKDFGAPPVGAAGGQNPYADPYTGGHAISFQTSAPV